MFVVRVTEYFNTPFGERKSCVGYDSIFITLYPGPEYNTPSAFTPNGDGLNDIFRPVPSGISSTIWFKIFNRNGEMLFQSNRWMYGWDGTRNGAQQPPGTYVWVIRGYDRNNNIVERKGTILLLR
jgi:gliding motility-associated-like protein